MANPRITMSADEATILQHLRAVQRERAARASSAPLLMRVEAIKAYQQRRFSHTYTDLSASPRYGAAVRFFLEDLYGPGDFSQRDAQFTRVVPAIVRLFPIAVVDTVATLAQLHALSEELDGLMAGHHEAPTVNATTYTQAWREVGRNADRETQVALTLSVGQALDDLTRKPLLRQSLRLMRGPALAAGLSTLQEFLESGFDTFKAMRGAQEFLAAVSTRERSLLGSLFGQEPGHTLQALGQLP